MTPASVDDFIYNRRRNSLPFTSVVTCASTAKNGDVVLTIRMPEKEEEEEDETVDASELEFSPNALDRVRIQDPFLYYSIQNEMRKRNTDSVAAARGAISISSESANNNIMPNASSSACIQAKSGKGELRRTSMPTKTGTTHSKQRQTRRHSTIGSINVVKRQRRLSTEIHPSQMFEVMINGDADLDLDGSQFGLDNVEEEDLFSLLHDD